MEWNLRQKYRLCLLKCLAEYQSAQGIVYGGNSIKTHQFSQLEVLYEGKNLWYNDSFR